MAHILWSSSHLARTFCLLSFCNFYSALSSFSSFVFPLLVQPSANSPCIPHSLHLAVLFTAVVRRVFLFPSRWFCARGYPASLSLSISPNAIRRPSHCLHCYPLVSVQFRAISGHPTPPSAQCVVLGEIVVESSCFCCCQNIPLYFRHWFCARR